MRKTRREIEGGKKGSPGRGNVLQVADGNFSKVFFFSGTLQFSRIRAKLIFDRSDLSLLLPCLLFFFCDGTCRASRLGARFLVRVAIFINLYNNSFDSP